MSLLLGTFTVSMKDISSVTLRATFYSTRSNLEARHSTSLEYHQKSNAPCLSTDYLAWVRMIVKNILEEFRKGHLIIGSGLLVPSPKN